MEGVVIPQETVEDSKKKRKNHRSLRQTEIYRDVKNLKHEIAKLMCFSPHKMLKFYDAMLVTVSNAKQSLALSLDDIRISEEERRANISYAKVMIEDLLDDAESLHKLGIINKENYKTVKKLAQKIAGQCVRLRDYFNSQGIRADGETLDGELSSTT